MPLGTCWGHRSDARPRPVKPLKYPGLFPGPFGSDSCELAGMEDAIRNRVEESGLIQLDLGAALGGRMLRDLDLAPQLWEGLVLREKPYREWLAALDQGAFKGADVALHCSADAVIPEWAWMLAASTLQPVAAAVYLCHPDALPGEVLKRLVEEMDILPYQDKRLVVKGCGLATGAAPSVRLVERLQPVVRSLMFGEPCSTVPVYKSR